MNWRAVRNAAVALALAAGCVHAIATPADTNSNRNRNHNRNHQADVSMMDLDQRHADTMPADATASQVFPPSAVSVVSSPSPSPAAVKQRKKCRSKTASSIVPSPTPSVIAYTTSRLDHASGDLEDMDMQMDMDDMETDVIMEEADAVGVNAMMELAMEMEMDKEDADADGRDDGHRQAAPRLHPQPVPLGRVGEDDAQEPPRSADTVEDEDSTLADAVHPPVVIVPWGPGPGVKKAPQPQPQPKPQPQTQPQPQPQQQLPPPPQQQTPKTTPLPPPPPPPPSPPQKPQGPDHPILTPAQKTHIANAVQDGYNEINIIRAYYKLPKLTPDLTLQSQAEFKSNSLSKSGTNCGISTASHYQYDYHGTFPSEVLNSVSGGEYLGLPGLEQYPLRHAFADFLVEGTVEDEKGVSLGQAKVHFEHASAILWPKATRVGCAVAIGFHSNPLYKGCSIVTCKFDHANDNTDTSGLPRYKRVRTDRGETMWYLSRFKG